MGFIGGFIRRFYGISLAFLEYHGNINDKEHRKVENPNLVLNHVCTEQIRWLRPTK